MEKEMEKEKNMLIMMNQYLKENIYMEKEMEKEKNMINMEGLFLKENI